MTGSSFAHVNSIIAVAISSVGLYSAIRSRLPATRPLPFFAEWTLLVLPLLLSVTLFANVPVLLVAFLLVPSVLLLFIPPSDERVALPSDQSQISSLPPSPPPLADDQAQGVPVAPFPALTTYRADMLLLTFISILAVDFPVYPRTLAKCETWGVSLMDVATGAFIYSQGIVSAIPILKDPGHLDSPLFPKFLSTARKSLPILVLGIIRVILVKGTEYPEHETEYGTHWNFFLTLAVIPAFQVLLHPIIRHAPISLFGVLVGLSHQFALSFLGWQQHVLYTPRTNIISANKEGLVSLPGYLSIHLLGLSAGTLLLPPSPSYFRRRQRADQDTSRRRKRSDAASRQYPSAAGSSPVNTLQRKNDKTATELVSYAVVWWALLGVAQLSGVGGGVSRRMANLPYILWVAAVNITALFCYVMLDLIFFPSPLCKSFYSPVSGLKALPPVPLVKSKEQTPAPLLEAVNKNGFVWFLLANIVTGVINLSVKTMYTPDRWAMAILTGYIFGISVLAWVFRGRRIWRL